MGKDELQAGPELDALVAEKVMGWGEARSSSILGSHSGCAAGGGRDGAARLLDVKSPFVKNAPWHAGFTERGTTGWNGRLDFRGSADTPALAICRAALQAMTGTLSTEE